MRRVLKINNVTNDADYQQYVYNADNSGGIVRQFERQAVAVFIADLKRYGIWNKILECAPMAGFNLAGAATKLKYTSPALKYLNLVNFVNGDWTSTGGLDPGNPNTGKYIDTGFIPSNYVPIDNFHAAIHSVLDGAAYSAGEMGAIVSSSQLTALYLSFTGVVTAFDCWNDSTSRATGGVTGQGCFIATRTSNTESRIYKNGTAIATSVGSGGTIPNISMYVGGFNSGGLPTSLSPRQIGFYSIGYGLSNGEAATYTKLIQTLMQAFGRPI